MIKPWITNIVFVMFFLILTDLLLPEGNIKQYVKVILGLFVLIAITKPFIEMKNINITFQNTYLETSAFLEKNSLAYDVEVLNTYQKEKTIKIYEDSIKNMVINRIAQEISIDKKNIDVQLEIEKNYRSTDFGKLKYILVTIPEKSDNANIERIKKVSILESKNVIYKDEKEYNFNDKTSTKNLKNLLSKLLSINQDNIQVKLTLENK